MNSCIPLNCMANLPLLFDKDRGAVCLLRRSAPAKQNAFMPVKIRLKRVGARNTPAFRVVVADGRSPRDGKFIEEIGTYLPGQKDINFKINLERADYWVSKGAQPSDTVASFIKKARRAATTAVAAK
ncbi:MAG: hypothetical protein RL514_725 [Verrucomicrobiota bacterium]